MKNHTAGWASNRENRVNGRKPVRISLVLSLLTVLLLSGCSNPLSGSAQGAPDQDTAEAPEAKDTEEGLLLQPEEVLTFSDDTEAAPDSGAVHLASIRITATGDCTLGNMQEHSYAGSFAAYYDSYGEDYFFEGVRDIFEADDFTVINLECVLSDSTERVDKEYNLKGKPEYAGIMTGSSVEGASLGNNHSMDYGYQSLVDTENVLEEAGIVYGYNEHVGLYETSDGLKVGMVSASLLNQSAERENYIRDGIARLREEGADLVIACCHWGVEREYYPTEYQRAAAHRVIDWGADLIIGNHPHVLQGIEYYNGKMICYSLGNFCFGGNKNPTDKDTMLYTQTFSFADGSLMEGVDAEVIPCTLSSVAGYNDFQPSVAQGEKRDQILENVRKYSEGLGDFTIDDAGAVLVPGTSESAAPDTEGE